MLAGQRGYERGKDCPSSFGKRTKVRQAPPKCSRSSLFCTSIRIKLATHAAFSAVHPALIIPRHCQIVIAAAGLISSVFQDTVSAFSESNSNAQIEVKKAKPSEKNEYPTKPVDPQIGQTRINALVFDRWDGVGVQALYLCYHPM
jgi:hypothetical protein